MPGKHPGRSGQPPPRGSPSTNRFHYFALSDSDAGLDVEVESLEAAASDCFSDVLSDALPADFSSLDALEREELPDGDL